MLNYMKKLYKKYLFKIYVKLFFIQNYLLICYNEFYRNVTNKSYNRFGRKA